MIKCIKDPFNISRTSIAPCVRSLSRVSLSRASGTESRTMCSYVSNPHFSHFEYVWFAAPVREDVAKDLLLFQEMAAGELPLSGERTPAGSIGVIVIAHD